MDMNFTWWESKTCLNQATDQTKRHFSISFLPLTLPPSLSNASTPRKSSRQ